MDSDHAAVTLKWLASRRELGITIHHDEGQEFSVIHPCELEEPGEFLVGGCVVLFTGIAYRSRPEALADHVRKLARAGVSGIGFGVEVVFPSVPESMREAAAEEGVALFSISLEVPFIKVLHEVQEELSRQRNQRRELLLEAQRQLNTAANSGGLENLLKVGAQNLHAHLVLMDNDGRVSAEVRNNQVPEFSMDQLRHWIQESPGDMAKRVGPLTVIGQKIDAFGERSLMLIAVSTQAFATESRALLRHCAGLAELIVARPQRYRAIHQELNSLALALQLGFNVEPGQVRTKIFHSVADSEGKVRPALLKGRSARGVSRIMKTVDQSLERAGRLLFSLDIDDCSVFMIFRGDRTPEEIIDLFQSVLGDARLAVGGQLNWDELEIDVLHQLERIILRARIGGCIGPKESGLDWLQERPVQHAMKKRNEETWGRLDGAGEDLGCTLEAYLRNVGNLSHTARELKIHRHTVSKRLAKIEELIEVDLEDPVTRAELLIVAHSCECA
ncbi:PucR family transcriptional regulator [Corynebacterium poyangense]|nr:PucR family transcriptional regulator [Corynebacterium poyangense]